MGTDVNINHDKFPLQGSFLGIDVLVTFMYDTKRTLKGVVVRDDMEAPGRMIIKLENGNYVLSTECQWRPAPKPDKIRFDITRKFTGPLYRQPDGAPLGIHETSTLVHVDEDGRSYAEFSVSSIAHFAEIGLWFERTDAGLVLTDYDGTHSLPCPVIEILKERGILVTEDFV